MSGPTSFSSIHALIHSLTVGVIRGGGYWVQNKMTLVTHVRLTDFIFDKI